MDYMTLKVTGSAAMTEESLSVTSLYAALQELPDPRSAQGKRYELALILCVLVLAKLAGQTNVCGATQWLRHRSATLAQRFGLRRTQMPCQMKYCNVLAVIDAKPLDDIVSAFFLRWEAASADVQRNQVACRLPKARSIIAIWPLMAMRSEPPANKPIRFTNSVVMRWQLAGCSGIATCRRNTMRSVNSSRYKRWKRSKDAFSAWMRCIRNGNFALRCSGLKETTCSLPKTTSRRSKRISRTFLCDRTPDRRRWQEAETWDPRARAPGAPPDCV
jgi:hypothetical protein